MNRGEIYMAELLEIGNVQGGLRPVIIIQNNVGNHFSKTVTIIPITRSKKKHIHTHVYLKRDEKNTLLENSTALVENIRTIPVDDLRKRIGYLSEEDMRRIEKKILLQLGFKEHCYV